MPKICATNRLTVFADVLKLHRFLSFTVVSASTLRSLHFRFYAVRHFAIDWGDWFFQRHQLFLVEVRRVEEVGEEEEVADVHHDGIVNVLHRLLAIVAARLHFVRLNVDEYADGHLRYLHRRDHHVDRLRYAHLYGAEGVVGVHERVHGVVHHHEPATGRRVVGVAVPHVDEHADVMVPVQEDEALLSEDDEDRVAQFVHLRHGEHVRPEADGAVEVGWTAHRVLPSVLPDDVHQFGHGSDGAERTEDRQHGTPRG